jgi:hypothetical protein
MTEIASMGTPEAVPADVPRTADGVEIKEGMTIYGLPDDCTEIWPWVMKRGYKFGKWKGSLPCWYFEDEYGTQRPLINFCSTPYAALVTNLKFDIGKIEDQLVVFRGRLNAFVEAMANSDAGKPVNPQAKET